MFGPSQAVLNFALYRNIPIHSESFSIQLRAEMFNALNHPNFAAPGDKTVFPSSAIPGDAPIALDALAAAVAVGASALVGLLVAVPIYQGITTAFGRQFAASAATPFGFPAAISLSTLLVIVARSVRPFVPDLAPFAERLRAVIAVADPVPAGHAAFAALDTIVSRTTATFTLFEQRAGVWLATVLIVALLIWSVRP